MTASVLKQNPNLCLVFGSYYRRFEFSFLRARLVELPLVGWIEYVLVNSVSGPVENEAVFGGQAVTIVGVITALT